MPSGPDELEAEQAYIDDAYAQLERMRERAAGLVGQSEDPDLEFALARRVRLLTDNGRPLCFGRIDHDDGESWYIGRRHVEDQKADPVVVEWRAPVAIPFYRASLAEPLGLVRRRQFVLDGRTIASMGDDAFARAATAAAHDDGLRIRGRDALIAELERARTGEMLDIVATIQAEQDEVIRAPLEGILTVQGGPGTGKTAIGLHRAAYLLYAHPELSRSGVLVIGPNRIFLRYIAQVLPSLGEEAVVQTTLRDLVPDYRVKSQDAPDTARLKGDARMAGVLRTALDGHRRHLGEDRELRYGLARLRLPAGAVNEALDGLAARRAPYSVGRIALRDRLLRVAYDAYVQSTGRLNAVDFGIVARELRRDAGFVGLLDELWPSVTAAGLVRELFADPERWAGDQLTPVERDLVRRKSGRAARSEPWTDADLALIDQAVELISGTARTYGHVVVDEAQDLSPMQVRMLARRCPAGSVTVLGDLAQATGVWGRDDWRETVVHLPQPKGWQHRDLRLGYRAPGRVLDLASRLLPEAAPAIDPTTSIRPGRTEPAIIATVDTPAAVVDAAVAEAARLTALHPSLAMVVPHALAPALAQALGRSGLDWADADRTGLGHPVSLVPAQEAKGLEFDAVVVVEPAAIAAELDDPRRGLRLLYICLTRPTQHLSVVHGRPLPAALAS